MKHLPGVESVAFLMSVALACLAVAFAVIAVVSDVGPTWAWIMLAVLATVAGSAMLRVSAATAKT